MIDKRQFKATSLFVILQHVIESELKDLEDYIDEISIDLTDKQKKLEDDISKANINIEDNSEFDYQSFFDEDINRYLIVFPVYTYNPLMLTIFGLFENWLKKLCDIDNRKGLNLIKVADLNGEGYIEKSRKYLKLVAEIDLGDEDNIWKEITKYRKIRNLISHNNSNIIKDSSKKIIQQEMFLIISKDDGIEFDLATGDFYIKDKEFLKLFIKTIKIYLKSIIDQLKIRKIVLKNSSYPLQDGFWIKQNTEEMLNKFTTLIDIIDKSEIKNNNNNQLDLNSKLEDSIDILSQNLTKQFAFFCNAKWEESDKNLIINNKELGLIDLKKIYNS